MKIKTSELTSFALDWAVTKAIGEYRPIAVPSYSTDWAIAGPIIERERIRLDPREGEWQAQDWQDFKNNYGPTPLIAAMRCYVASKLGNEVDVPDELS